MEIFASNGWNFLAIKFSFSLMRFLYVLKLLVNSSCSPIIEVWFVIMGNYMP
jgi:hypothetical protein